METSADVCELAAIDYQLIQKLMEDELHIKQKKILHEDCLTARYAWSLFHAVLLMSSLFHDDDDDVSG